MTDRETGYVAYVDTETRGSQTYAAALAGATTITVTDGSDFRQTGGQLDIDQAGSPLSYDALVINTDATGTITLSNPLASAVTEGQRVDVWARGGPSTFYTASVVTPNDTVLAYLPAHLVPHLVTGPRAAGDMEFVELEWRDDGWLVVDVPLLEPSIDLGYANPDLPMTPGTLAVTHTTYADELAGAIPPTAFGSGQVNGDITFVGKTVLGGMTSSAQGTVVRAADGSALLFVDPSGVVTHLAQFASFLSLLTQAARLSGPTRGIAGGSFTLEDAGLLAPPTLPPITDFDWVTYPIGFPDAVDAANLLGLAVKSTTEHACLRVSNKGQVRVLKWNPASPATVTSAAMNGAPTETLIVSFDWSSHAALLQCLEWDPAAMVWLMRYYDWSTLAFSHQWTVTQLGSVFSPKPTAAVTSAGVAHEYTRVLRSNAVSNSSGGTITVHKFADEVFVASQTTADSFPFYDLQDAGCLGSIVEFTGTTNMVATASTWPGIPAGQAVVPVIVLDSFFPGFTAGMTLGYLQTAYNDLVAAGIGALDGDPNFHTWYLSGRSDSEFNQSNPVEAGSYWVAVTYYDSATGHETVMSTPTLQTKVPGARVTFTVSPPPVGSQADSQRTYMARDLGAGAPARTAFWRQGTSTPGSYKVAVLDVLSSGSNPPATGTCTTGAPFIIKSGAGVTLMDGTGYVAGGGGGAALGVDDDVFLGTDYIEVTGRV